MPMRQRRSGVRCVMSMPAKKTRPASGATVPLAMPNNVVLPAPFGPMMPSASPSARARSIASATTTAPNRLEIPWRRRRGHFALAGGLVTSRQQLKPPANRNLRGGLVGGDDKVEAVALALPLSGDERGLGDVLYRLAGPLHRADDRFVVRGGPGREERPRLQRLGALAPVRPHPDRAGRGG